MGTILSEVAAARLQYFTFSLELAGFALALIELRFPAIAAALTEWIERLATPVYPGGTQSDSDASPLDRSLSTFLSRILTTGVYVLTAVYFVHLGSRFFRHDTYDGWLVGFALEYLFAVISVTVLLVVLGLAAYFFVVGGSTFAQRFVAGRAIGTLGILIAGVGLLGECYQVLVQLSM